MMMDTGRTLGSDDFTIDFDSYIKLAADDVSKLRFCDVDRVMEQAVNDEELIELSQYLLTVRPDFDVAEVCEIEHEIGKEKGWRK